MHTIVSLVQTIKTLEVFKY